MPVDSPSDPELLARARTGDELALANLYERHVDGLWTFVFYRVGRDADLCEDVVQETFLLALERQVGEPPIARVGFDPERGSLRGWLCTLSRNLIRKHLRSNQRAMEMSATWERIDATLMQVFQSLDREPIGDEVLARAETRELVNMTIANLPEGYRDALERKYVQGHSLRELAERFELSEAATKSLLARARRAFRETFETLAHAFSTPGGLAKALAEQELPDVRA